MSGVRTQKMHAFTLAQTHTRRHRPDIIQKYKNRRQRMTRRRHVRATRCVCFVRVHLNSDNENKYQQVVSNGFRFHRIRPQITYPARINVTRCEWRFFALFLGRRTPHKPE